MLGEVLLDAGSVTVMTAVKTDQQMSRGSFTSAFSASDFALSWGSFENGIILFFQ
jgi:hypothetical protein